MVFFFFLHYRFSTARGLGIHMGKLCTPAHLETNTHHQPDKHLLNRSNPINKFDDFFNNWDCLDRIDRKSSGELHWVAHILLLPLSAAWLPPGIGKLGKCLSRGCVTMKLLFLSFFFFLLEPTWWVSKALSADPVQLYMLQRISVTTRDLGTV